MATVARTSGDRRRAVRDSLVVSVGGQLERALGTLTALALRSSWLGLDPGRMGVYTGLRLFLDNTNRSSLGISLGAVQEIPVLRASGRESEARRVADVAYTTNTLTCLVYAGALLVASRLWAPRLAGDPLAAEWTWGLVAVAGLAIVKRYQDFLIAVLRSYQEFVLTTELAVLDAVVSAVSTVAGLYLAGYWGLLAAVGTLLSFNIVYLHARHSLRFRWCWDAGSAWRLMRVGLPILANTAAFGAVLNLDRVLILSLVPDGERALGLYTIALMGTSWSLDLAGRIATVLYTYFQTTLGRTGEVAEVALQAARVTEAQAPLLAAGGAVAYLVGPEFLGTLLPRYAGGLPALRPLLPGMVVLGLAWPARQMLIAVGRPYRLCLATLAGLGIAALAGAIGAMRAGLVGVATGLSFGYAIVFVLTYAAGFSPALGVAGVSRSLGRLSWAVGPYAAAAVAAAHLPLPIAGRYADLGARLLILSALGLPMLWAWGRRHAWGGMIRRRSDEGG